MKDFKVQLSSQNFNVKISPQKNYKVTLGSGSAVVPARFTDLIDFDGSDGGPGLVVIQY